jgi:5'-3' exoribonuclease 2
MGVPRLAPWIFNNFKHSRNKLFLNSTTTNPNGLRQVDNLYIDANGILHGSAQEIFNYGENKRIIDPLKGIKYDEKINMLFENFWEKILQIMQAVKPTRLLYIAIDGTAPIAKQIQQRQRRFVAARDALCSTGSAARASQFNSNCITPGTEFMDNLTTFIEVKIKEFLTQRSGSRASSLGVIFSPPSDPGEGEHKIMNFIRSRKEADEVFNKYSHCIFSPDGDLIMLCLSTYLDQIFLLRTTMEPDTFDYINMSYVSKNLIEYIYESKVLARNKYDVVNDFILAGFFVGNDFLPKIQMFYTLEEGLQSMLNVCKYLSKHNTFLTRNFKIDKKAFAEFVSLIADDEVKHLIKQGKIVYTQSSGKEKFNDLIAQKYVGTSGTETFDFKNYSNEYYETHFPGVSRDEVCYEYLKSLWWVLVYYTQKIPSWRYHYKYHYAPLMTDFAAFLKTPAAVKLMNNDVSVTFELGEPCAPVVQLLCVLPSTSRDLIPEKFRDLKPTAESADGANELKFKVDYAGKTKEYMGVALIEPADVDEIEQKYNSVVAGDDASTFEFQNPKFYFYSPQTKNVETLIIE